MPRAAASEIFTLDSQFNGVFSAARLPVEGRQYRKMILIHNGRQERKVGM